MPRPAEGVTASLADGAGTAGQATGDSYTQVEGLVGTAQDDSLSGNAARNWLSGLDGDDLIFGGAGKDHLKGGVGDDTLRGGGGSDRAYFDGDLADYTVTRTADSDNISGLSALSASGRLNSIVRQCCATAT